MCQRAALSMNRNSNEEGGGCDVLIVLVDVNDMHAWLEVVDEGAASIICFLLSRLTTYAVLVRIMMQYSHIRHQHQLKSAKSVNV